VKYIAEVKRGADKESLPTYNSTIVSTSASSLSIRELKSNLAHKEVPRENDSNYYGRDNEKGEPRFDLNIIPESVSRNTEKVEIQFVLPENQPRKEMRDSTFNENRGLTESKYGNDMKGKEMSSMFEKMRMVLETYKQKEDNWFQEKVTLLHRIAELEQKVTSYENNAY